MPVVSIRHLTRYRYRRPVAFGEHRMMFRPHESHDQRLLSSHVAILPAPTQLRHVEDVFGNCLGVASFGQRSSELVFESRVRIEHRPLPPFADRDGECHAPAKTSRFAYEPDEMPDLRRSMERDHPDTKGEVARWARRFAAPIGPASLPDLLTEMTQFIHANFTYQSRLETGTRTPQETLSLGSGSCRDFAVLMIEAVRSMGLAARYVSGYIHSPSPGAARKGAGDGGHTHAWARVYLPACGWVDFDPTNGMVGNRDLVRVAVARSPRQAIPLHGTWRGDASDFLGMDVQVEISTKERAGARCFPGPLAVAAA
jgi:transglutaminase-like putative cysteine protease